MKAGITLMVVGSFLFLTSCSSLSSGKVKSNLCQSGQCRLDKSCCNDACGKCKGNDSCKNSSCSKCTSGKSCKLKHKKKS